MAGRRQGLAAGLLVAVGMALAGPAGAAGKGDEERLQRIDAAYRARDCRNVVGLGAPMLDRRGGSGLAAGAEAALYELVVDCHARLKAFDKAYAYALRATALDESSDYMWRIRLAGELQFKDHRAAVTTVEAMSQGRSAALNAMPMAWLWGLDRALEKESPDHRRRLLAVLAQDGYDPEELYEPADGFRMAYAKLLARAGEREAARAAALRLEMPYALMRAMLDPDLRSLLPAEVDLRARAEQSLLRYREAMARHPDRLAPLTEAAAALRLLGRPQEAVELLRAASERAGGPDAFEDGAERTNWYWDGVGRSEADLGHYDEAVAAFRKGAGAAEDGSPNVSQIINLAFFQATSRRADEALKTLAVFDPPGRQASPYGFMEMRLARGCAHFLAGHQAEAKADLDYMLAHEADHPEALSDLLLCMNDLDGAAASFIRRLGNDDQKVAALLQLSDYDPPPVADPDDPVDGRLPAVRARADVQAAIARAGGTRRFPLQRGQL